MTRKSFLASALGFLTFGLYRSKAQSSDPRLPVFSVVDFPDKPTYYLSFRTLDGGTCTVAADSVRDAMEIAVGMLTPRQPLS